MINRFNNYLEKFNPQMGDALAKINGVCDYIPVVSTFSNLVGIFQK